MYAPQPPHREFGTLCSVSDLARSRCHPSPTVQGKWWLGAAVAVASRFHVDRKQRRFRSCRRHCLHAEHAGDASSYLVGLVSKDHGCSEEHYAATLPVGFMDEDVMNSGEEFMRAARADAAEAQIPVEQYLQAAEKEARSFVRSNVLHDRKELLETLEEDAFMQGTMSLLLGGKHVGKSQVIKQLVDGNHRKWNARKTCDSKADPMPIIVNVDCRTEGVDVMKLECALVNAALRHPALKQSLRGWLLPAWSWARIVSSLTLAWRSVRGNQSDVTLNIADLIQKFTPQSTIETTMELAEKKGGYLVLVVDEANIALPGPNTYQNEEKAERVRAFLEIMVSVTKQSNGASCLLSASEHAYPSRLRMLCFNDLNFEMRIYAGEVPPNSMRELLHAWGLGPRTTNLLMAHYGGHIHYTRMALKRLARSKEEFLPQTLGPLQAIMRGCVEAMEEDPKAEQLLSELAIYGYAVIRGGRMDDETAEVICRNNVGAVVLADKYVVGLRDEIIQQHTNKAILVPTCQAARCIIMSILQGDASYWIPRSLRWLES